MIVSRIFYYPRPGCWVDLEELFKATMPKSLSNPHLHAFRLYRRQEGSSAPVSVELEFENNGELAKFWADMLADPESAAIGKKYEDLIYRDMTSEIWELVE